MPSSAPTARSSCFSSSCCRMPIARTASSCSATPSSISSIEFFAARAISSALVPQLLEPVDQLRPALRQRRLRQAEECTLHRVECGMVLEGQEVLVCDRVRLRPQVRPDPGSRPSRPTANGHRVRQCVFTSKKASRDSRPLPSLLSTAGLTHASALTVATVAAKSLLCKPIAVEDRAQRCGNQCR